MNIIVVYMRFGRQPLYPKLMILTKKSYNKEHEWNGLSLLWILLFISMFT
jgi:hypothetical protein